MEGFRLPWEDLAGGDATAIGLAASPAVSSVPEPQPKRRGRRPGIATHEPTHAAEQGAAPAGWLYHHLTVSGPAEALATFAGAARGAGVIPWRLDGTRLEEDVFALAVAQPPEQRRLTVAGCRILARQIRDRAEARHARAIAVVGTSRACPFDLYALLPVPDVILALGPVHPDALAWLMANWGVSDAPRQVAMLDQPRPGRRLPTGQGVIGYGFFTAAPETPQPAIDILAARCPELRLRLQPRS